MRDGIIDEVLTKQIRIPTHEPGLLDNHIVSHSHGKPKSRLTMKFVVFLTFTLNSTHFFFILHFPRHGSSSNFGPIISVGSRICTSSFAIGNSRFQGNPAHRRAIAAARTWRGRSLQHIRMDKF